MKKEIIRYDPGNSRHRKRVREILWDTGFGGKPLDPFFDEFDLFADLNVLYYTDYEPHHNFLAVADGEIIGYLLGCTDSDRYEKTMKKEIGPKILKSVLSGDYRLSSRDAKFLLRTAYAALDGISHAPFEQYPAHLHIDFDNGFRRIGLGSQIMQVFFDHLRSLGVKGVQLGTSSFHRSALPFYRKLGFTEFARDRLTYHGYWDHTKETMYNIIYVKTL